jgi:hypothetical protein
MRLFTFRNLRIFTLLVILAVTAFYTSHQYVFTRNWSKTLKVVVFPINGDAHPATSRYIKALQVKNFMSINQWAYKQAKHYNLPVDRPFEMLLGQTVTVLPPQLPKNSSLISVLFWGLKIRWWAFNNTPDNESNLERIRMFVVYQQGEKGKALPHSLGLQKGLMGVVYAYAQNKQNKQNNIVIAHELLHTVGASDKYDATGLPIYPEGYAQAKRQPLYPQRKAEIMAGHIPSSKNKSKMAPSLKRVVVNHFTAGEINWIQP